MAKRKALGKKIRFEVLKRDNFTCQYCGSTAPNVLLEIDHIEPVAKGGTNDLLNLVTSCEGCNRGKSARRLDDDSVVAKQLAELSRMQERREQREMMLRWRNELEDQDDDIAERLIEFVERKIEPRFLSDFGEKNIRRLVKKHELEEILDAIDVSASTYLRFDEEGVLTAESVDECLNKIPGIIVNKKKPPIQQKISYVMGIGRNRFSYWQDQTGAIKINDYIQVLKHEGYSEEEILKDLEEEVIPMTKRARNWSQWGNTLENWAREMGDSEETAEPDTQPTSSDEQPKPRVAPERLSSHQRDEFITDLLEPPDGALKAIRDVTRFYHDEPDETIKGYMYEAVILYLTEWLRFQTDEEAGEEGFEPNDSGTHHDIVMRSDLYLLHAGDKPPGSIFTGTVFNRCMFDALIGATTAFLHSFKIFEDPYEVCAADWKEIRDFLYEVSEESLEDHHIH